MVRRRKKNKTRRVAFTLGSSKRRSKAADSPSPIGILKVLALVGILAALGFGFVFIDKYAKKVAPAWGKTVEVELIEPPAWVNQSLKDKILAAVTFSSEALKLDEDAVRLIQSNLARKVSWLQKVKVQAAHNKILIQADYRKPIAHVKSGLRNFYVDAELVVLDFVPMPDLPIVKVKGLSPITKIPPVGKVWQREDLAAAAAILARLDRMDKLVTPDKPLLYEIDSIDVSNFRGREDNRLAHIILHAKDNTEIIWGAEIDAWSQYLEARDEEKLAKLYNYYKEQGSLLGGAKYIDLRAPQGHIPLPIDKY